MKPISTFDMKNAQGSAKHRLVFVRVRIKIIRNNRKNNFKRKAKRNFDFIRWTNITELNFNPQLEQVINNDHLVRPFLVFRSAESHFSSNILGFLNISWY
jgi:hypothetical protein